MEVCYIDQLNALEYLFNHKIKLRLKANNFPFICYDINDEKFYMFNKDVISIDNIEYKNNHKDVINMKIDTSGVIDNYFDT